MKLKLKHKDFCDGCEQLVELNTLASHKRCKVYDKVMLPREDLFGTEYKGLGMIKRPDYCMQENEAEVVK